MGYYTNEKSLVVIQDNFFTKVKNFFAKAFWNRKSKYQIIEDEEDNNQDYSEQFEQQENVQKQRRLYNFDADDNDDWPGDGNMNNVDDENETNMNNLNDNDNENNQNQEENLEEKYDREIYSEAYREKVELEQKLMNYYESIKKGI